MLLGEGSVREKPGKATIFRQGRFGKTDGFGREPGSLSS